MDILLHLLQREHDLIESKERSFRERVDLLHMLDECDLSDRERKETEARVKFLNDYEDRLCADIKQTRLSIKRYILKLLEL